MIAHSNESGGALLNRIETLVEDSLLLNGVCKIMLTGGRSAARLYASWSRARGNSSDCSGMHLYFSDERCVPPTHPESNYRLAVKTLFPSGIPNGVGIYRMEGESSDLEGAAERYAAILPESIDIMLLSIGEDGHIASLFPGGSTLNEMNRLVVPVMGPKHPHQRLTITPKVIGRAKHVLVMAYGQQKRMVYEKALAYPKEIDSLPARLVLDGEWFFGEEMCLKTQ